MTQTHLGGDSSGPSPSGVGAPGRARIAARTLRTDRWWVEPTVTFTLLVGWLLYALISTASQRYYFVEEYHYLSPFSSPCLSASCVPASRDFGTWFGEFPPFVPLGPAGPAVPARVPADLLLLPQGLLPLVLGSRRRPAPSPSRTGEYTGETRFPLILQNAHRYFFYAAIVVSLINTYDVIRAFHGKDGGVRYRARHADHAGERRLPLWAYTAVLSTPAATSSAAGCGHFSKHPTRYWLWTQVSKLNTRHMQLAWTTLGDPHGHGRLHRAGCRRASLPI